MKWSWYTFATTLITPQEGRPGWFSVQTLSTYSLSPERALKTVQARIPPGYRMWSWFEGLPATPDICCNMCGGVWHDATGHFEPEKGRIWCGVCTRMMVEFLWKQLLRRTKGKVKFYNHAYPPPNIDTSVEDLK